MGFGLPTTGERNECRGLGPLYKTSSLESFHSVIIHFAPKKSSFLVPWNEVHVKYISDLHYVKPSDEELYLTQHCVSF